MRTILLTVSSAFGAASLFLIFLIIKKAWNDHVLRKNLKEGDACLWHNGFGKIHVTVVTIYQGVIVVRDLFGNHFRVSINDLFS